jgi:GTP-binding protein EngB required for normal cell division
MEAQMEKSSATVEPDSNAAVSGALLSLASSLADRYHISAIQPLIESAHKIAENDELSVAVVGRFKAGKSSFLNHFLNRAILPVGVVPVTTVVTELSYGPTEKATVHFVKGETEAVPLSEVGSFVAESDNPGNRKGVSTVAIELPALAVFRSLRFVDLPGLESALAHNTNAVLSWLPNIGLALVAVSVDPPLSQHDIDLLRSVYRYTPHVAILLTKIDLLSNDELQDVTTFVRDRLAESFQSPPAIFPYSVRPGFEVHKTRLEEQLIRRTLAEFERRYRALIIRKLETVLRECRDYLTFALKSAETIESEREKLKLQVIGEKEALAEVNSELRLITQHAAAGARAAVAEILDAHQAKLSARLYSELNRQFPDWTKSLGFALESYENWLSESISKEMMAIAREERTHLLRPLETLTKQIFRTLQNFRDRLSLRSERTFGVPLRTTEPEIKVDEPQAPDIHIGHVFDRSWELLSPITPMFLLKPAVARHFRTRLPYMIEKNLSRLAAQWEETIKAAMAQLSREAERRLTELVETLERLIASSPDEAPKIRADLELINSSLHDIARGDTANA